MVNAFFFLIRIQKIDDQYHTHMFLVFGRFKNLDSAGKYKI